MTLADLPPPDTQRWVARRKAQVVAAVDGGLLCLEEACSRYALTVEEFLSWKRAVKRFGMAGLKATRVQEYRQADVKMLSAGMYARDGSGFGRTARI